MGGWARCGYPQTFSACVNQAARNDVTPGTTSARATRSCARAGSRAPTLSMRPRGSTPYALAKTDRRHLVSASRAPYEGSLRQDFRRGMNIAPNRAWSSSNPSVGNHLGRTPPIVNDLSLSIPDGQFCCIVGPSGAGKTTLLRLAAGLVAASAGRVSVDGQSPERARASLSYVFQQPVLFPWRSCGAGWRRMRTVRPQFDLNHVLPSSTVVGGFMAHVLHYRSAAPLDLAAGPGFEGEEVCATNAGPR